MRIGFSAICTLKAEESAGRESSGPVRGRRKNRIGSLPIFITGRTPNPHQGRREKGYHIPQRHKIPKRSGRNSPVRFLCVAGNKLPCPSLFRRLRWNPKPAQNCRIRGLQGQPAMNLWPEVQDSLRADPTPSSFPVSEKPSGTLPECVQAA